MCFIQEKLKVQSEKNKKWAQKQEKRKQEKVEGKGSVKISCNVMPHLEIDPTHKPLLLILGKS